MGQSLFAARHDNLVTVTDFKVMRMMNTGKTEDLPQGYADTSKDLIQAAACTVTYKLDSQNLLSVPRKQKPYARKQDFRDSNLPAFPQATSLATRTNSSTVVMCICCKNKYSSQVVQLVPAVCLYF